MFSRGPPGRRLYLVGLLVAVGGIVAAGVGLLAISGKVESFGRVVVPGTADLNLRAGNYTIYYEARSFVDGPVSSTAPMTGMSCRLTDPAGAPVELRPSSTGDHTVVCVIFDPAGKMVGTAEDTRQ